MLRAVGEGGAGGAGTSGKSNGASNAVSWLDGIVALCIVFVMFGVTSIVKSEGRQTQRQIPGLLVENGTEFMRDLRFNEEYKKHATVPYPMLIFLAYVLPLIVVILGTLFAAPRQHQRRFAAALWAATCVLLSLASTTLVTTALKMYVGYERPHYYDRCDFDFNESFRCLKPNNGAIRSFPSGHASESFAGLLFASLFVNDVMRVKSSNAIAQSSRLRSLVLLLQLALSAAPALVAAWIAASRVVDNHHFPADIVAGTILGSSFALASFYVVYLPLACCEEVSDDDVKHTPLSDEPL